MFNVTERAIKKAFNSVKSDIVEPEINEDNINDITTFIGGNIGKYEHKKPAFNIVENIKKNN